MNKRIIYTLFYKESNFYLSRNFRLQKVGDIDWLKNNFGFGETCHYIDELMIILVKPLPSEEDYNTYFKDVNELRKKIFVPITLGGGIRSLDQARKFFLNGADKILINTVFFQNHKVLKKISNNYGSQAISLMIDYNIDSNKNERTVYIECGTKKDAKLDSNLLLKILKSNCGEIILNSIEQDGTGAGLDVDVLNFIDDNFDKPLLMMGGSGKPDHLTEILKNKKVSGVVTANLFNFLGTGLEIYRNMAINSGIKLAKFNKINL
tara:strand:+ start:174 stop:965 length:792 start_codon:yes stop_codon:yes gene_type:complete